MNGRFRTVVYVMTAALSVTMVWLTFGILASCRVPAPVEPDVVIVVTDSDAGRFILGDAAPTCMTAAENLHAIGCSEAADAGAFAVVCAHAKAENLTIVDVGCMSRAASKDVARMCAGIGAQGCP